jgi:hypothetical protein
MPRAGMNDSEKLSSLDVERFQGGRCLKKTGNITHSEEVQTRAVKK